MTLFKLRDLKVKGWTDGCFYKTQRGLKDSNRESFIVQKLQFEGKWNFHLWILGNVNLIWKFLGWKKKGNLLNGVLGALLFAFPQLPLTLCLSVAQTHSGALRAPPHHYRHRKRRCGEHRPAALCLVTTPPPITTNTERGKLRLRPPPCCPSSFAQFLLNRFPVSAEKK